MHGFNRSRYINCRPDFRKCVPVCSITDMGELIINGGFENQTDPFFGWIINSGVDQIDPGSGDTPHQGLNAARLGFVNPWALLYQDVPKVIPETHYQLSFFMSTEKDWGNAPVQVHLQFLDKLKNLLVNSELAFTIPENSLHESYTGFLNVTKICAPRCSAFARISFEIDSGADADRHVHLDDVSLVAVRSRTFILKN